MPAHLVVDLQLALAKLLNNPNAEMNLTTEIV